MFVPFWPPPLLPPRYPPRPLIGWIFRVVLFGRAITMRISCEVLCETSQVCANFTRKNACAASQTSQRLHKPLLVCPSRFSQTSETSEFTQVCANFTNFTSKLKGGFTRQRENFPLFATFSVYTSSRKLHKLHKSHRQDEK